jgi:phytoene dehydrogenase-like protein
MTPGTSVLLWKFYSIVGLLLVCLCRTTTAFLTSSPFLTVPHHPSSEPSIPTIEYDSVSSSSFSLRALSGTTTSNNDNQVDGDETVDVIVVGAGIGGLTCAGLAGKYGFQTLCLEAHDTPGGVAHSFSRYTSASKTQPFIFDSGPSLISGLSAKGTNPLRQVLDALDIVDDITWKTYDGWIVHDNADGTSFKLTTGDGGQWEESLEVKAGREARQQFTSFKEKILEKRGLAIASTYIPPFALRGGVAAVASLARYTLKLLSIGSKGNMLTSDFGHVMDHYKLQNKFVRKWFDYLAFALSGLDASHTQSAAVAYMMLDLHKPGAVLDYPMGGMGALIDTMAYGVAKYGGEVRLNSRVAKFLLEERNGKPTCTGVILANGKVIRARKGVVCNAPLWNMARILQDSVDDHTTDSASPVVLHAVEQVQERADSMNMTGSFMHIHLGIPKDGLPDDLECHHSVLNFDLPIDAEQNMVIISIPTVFDPSLAPEGYHIVHAYTAACDSFDPWDNFIGGESGKVGVDPNTAEAASYRKMDGYQELKEQRAEVLWKAIEKVIPDVRERAKQKGAIAIVGTPLTHRRYNQRFRGTYGPAPADGKRVWELAGATTPIKGLLACGDTCFPGIGLPGVAASGTIAANTLASLKSQNTLMDELRAKGALQ